MRLSDPHLCSMNLDKPGWGLCAPIIPQDAAGGLEYTEVYPHLPSTTGTIPDDLHSTSEIKGQKNKQLFRLN